MEIDVHCVKQGTFYITQISAYLNVQLSIIKTQLLVLAMFAILVFNLSYSIYLNVINIRLW